VVDEIPDDAVASSPELTPSLKSKGMTPQSPGSVENDLSTTQRELRTHEIAALVSCFVLPMIGAWLLHGIRSQLSRPSEGLISNYNLTVFLLAAEIRPVSHVVKMIQRRTLYLQRLASAAEEDPALDNIKLLDVSRRLEELEKHVADSAQAAAQAAAEDVAGSSELVAANASAQATSDLRKGIQPELDALNRAVRRYEKRMTISAIQTEARLQELETRLKDVVVLAAAAQRNSENQPNNFIVILLNWICGAIVLPVQYGAYILALPSKGAHAAWGFVARITTLKKPKDTRDPRVTRRGGSSRTRERKGKSES
jgi:hypothetical protein